MKKTWARCANCGKATWYCARHGCNPKPKTAAAPGMIWLGICDTPHGTAFALCEWKETAEIKLYHTWVESVYPGYPQEHGITNFQTFSEFVGARVQQVKMGQYGIWERLP
jgi:hypothetical protein